MSQVSRETSPGRPPEWIAARLGADALRSMARYADRLAGDGVVRGLIGPREVPRLWERHLGNCLLAEELIGLGKSVADVGSGAGLPGLVLSIARPDLQLTLVEPLLRRSTFLTECVAELGLTNTEVVRDRAEALAGRRRFDIVISRALAPLEQLLGWCLPLTGPGGRVLAIKGRQGEAEAAGIDLRRVRCRRPRVHQLGSGLAAEPTRVISVEPDGSWARVSKQRKAGRRVS